MNISIKIRSFRLKLWGVSSTYKAYLWTKFQFKIRSFRFSEGEGVRVGEGDLKEKTPQPYPHTHPQDFFALIRVDNSLSFYIRISYRLVEDRWLTVD